MTINSRVNRSSGCPECSRGVGRAKKRHPTVAESNDALLAEWDHPRNAALGLFPAEIRLRSQKKVFWLCPNCPAGQQHSYSATPNNRTGPCCSGLKACKCNSLQAHYPVLTPEWDFSKNEATPEWDFSKNEATPDNHPAHCHYQAWWIPPDGNSWQQSIHYQTCNIDLARRGGSLKKMVCNGPGQCLLLHGSRQCKSLLKLAAMILSCVSSPVTARD